MEASACESTGTWRVALPHLNALVAAEPGSWMLLKRRQGAYSGLGLWPEAIADTSKAIALRPERDALWRAAGLYSLRGFAEAELGHWEEAAADLTRAIEQDVGDLELQLDLAQIRLANGDIDGYRKDCARLVHDAKLADAPRIANFAAWTCILSPEAVPDLEAVVAHARGALEAASGDVETYDRLGTLAAATYRAGRFQETIDHLTEATKLIPKTDNSMVGRDVGASSAVTTELISGGIALDALFLAMAHYRLGHHEEARKWLSVAVASIDRGTRVSPNGNSSAANFDWNTRLWHRVLRREAESLIGGIGSDRPNAKAAAGTVR
jgi:tetratricopeptide (TPR) repeat protein